MTEELVCSNWKRIEQTPEDNLSITIFAGGVINSLGCK
jgi:hypothetical protein